MSSKTNIKRAPSQIISLKINYFSCNEVHISEEHFISLMIRYDYTISYSSICSCTVIVVSRIPETACELSGKYAFQILATVQSFKINYIFWISYSNRAIYYKKDYNTTLNIQFSVI